MNEFEELMSSIIDSKYNEVMARNSETGPFDKIKQFEGNAVGQIGEEFVKRAFVDSGIAIDNDANTIHDEYDVKIKNTKIEVKTARKGGNDTFQFNGINPIYNVKYIILIGISASKVYCKVLEKSWLHYEHHAQAYYFTIDGRDFKLVPMNPGNSVNYKLTLNVKYLDDISKFGPEILKIGVLANLDQ